MLGTTYAPYVGQRVTLLANEEEGWPEDEATYLGEGVLEDRRGEVFEADFSRSGLWIPSGSDKSAHQYVNELLQENADGTDFEGRTLLRGALETARRLGIEGEYAASIAVRAWQVAYEQTEEMENPGDVPARTPVLVTVTALEPLHVLGYLDEPLVPEARSVRVRYKLYAGDTPVSHLRFLP